MDDMGNAGVDAMDEKDLVSDPDLIVGDEIPGIGQAELDDIAAHLGIDDPRDGFKGKLLAGNPLQKRETRCAAAAIPAHLHFGTVGVEEAPAEIHPVGPFDHDQPVGPDRHLPCAYPLYELDDIPHGKQAVPVVDQYKVVPAPAHLIEFDHDPCLLSVMSLSFSGVFPVSAARLPPSCRCVPASEIQGRGPPGHTR